MSTYKPFIKALPIILLLATCMTCSSLLYLRPRDCDRDCSMNHEQKAGYPFVMAQEQGQIPNSSPLRPVFDLADIIEGVRPVGYLQNLLFYSSLLSVVWIIFRLGRQLAWKVGKAILIEPNDIRADEGE